MCDKNSEKLLAVTHFFATLAQLAQINILLLPSSCYYCSVVVIQLLHYYILFFPPVITRTLGTRKLVPGSTGSVVENW